MLATLLQVNGTISLTLPASFSDHLAAGQRFGVEMLIEIAVFSGLAICVSVILVRVYEWRHDVRYGPYVHRDDAKRR
jgi:hypothetical protein